MNVTDAGFVLKTKPSGQALKAVSYAANEILAKIDSEPGYAQYLGYHRHRLALDYDWIQQTSQKNEKICELGAYPFFLTRALVSSGLDVYPVDIPSPKLSTVAALAEVSTYPCNIETQHLPFPDEFFNHVLLNEVFEHLRIDPIFTAREILRVLKPGGRLWLSTPNLRSLRGIINFLFKGEAYSCMGEGLYHQYKALHEGGIGHVREYTSIEVTSFLTAVGFTVEGVIYRGEYSSPAARLLSSVAPSMKPFFSVLARRK